jgi:hypothetical protein
VKCPQCNHEHHASDMIDCGLVHENDETHEQTIEWLCVWCVTGKYADDPQGEKHGSKPEEPTNP